MQVRYSKPAVVPYIECVEGGRGPLGSVAGIDALSPEQRERAKEFCDDDVGGRRRADYVEHAAQAKRRRAGRVQGDPPPELEPPELDGDEDSSEKLKNLCWWNTVQWGDLKRWVPTMATVPNSTHHAVARLKRAVLLERQESKNLGDDLRCSRAWKILTFLDRLIFALPRQRGEETNALRVTRRVREAWRGNWQGLWEETKTSFGQQGTSSSQLAADARAINAYVADGLLSKAIGRARGASSFNSGPSTHGRLQSLFPAASLPDLGAPVAVGEEFRQELLSAARQGLTKHPKRSSPGPSGARFEHWATLAADEDATSLGAELLVDFLLGHCPADALRANLGARLVALNKKDGGIRPVAMGSVMRRLAARAACKVLKDSVWLL